MKIVLFTKPESHKTQKELPLVMTPTDLAEILCVSRNTTYEYIHSEGFPYVSVGKQIRIPRDMFLQWFNKQADKCNNE